MVIVGLGLTECKVVTAFYEATKVRLERQILILKPHIYLHKQKYLIYTGKPLIPISPLWIGLALNGLIWMFLQFHWLMWFGVAISSLSYFETISFTKKKILKGLTKAGYNGESKSLSTDEILEVILHGAV